MAKKKAEKKNKKQKENRAKNNKKKNLKKKDLKKKNLKKKESKKKDQKKKTLSEKKKKKEIKKNKVSSKREKSAKTDFPEKVIPIPAPKFLADHSSNYNVRDAAIKLRSLQTTEDVQAFTKGEKRLSITRIIPAAIRRLR